jgi:1,4-dihydroxy-2-naphthoate octaprenyltransferase
MIGNSSLDSLYLFAIVLIVVAAILMIASILAIVALVYAIRLMARAVRQQDDEALRRHLESPAEASR